MNKLYALLSLNMEDRHKLKLMAPIFLFAGISELLIYSAFMALFNIRFGVDKLPYIYLLEAIILPIEGWIMAMISNRISKPKFMQLTYNGLIIILLINGSLLLLFKYLNVSMYYFYPVLFVASSFVIRQQTILLWSTAFDLCPTQQAKRLVPAFVSLALVGGFAAGFIVQWIGPVFGNEILYLLSPIFLIAVLWNFRTSLQRYLVPLTLKHDRREEETESSLSSSFYFKQTLRSPFLLCAIALMTLMPALYFLMEYQYFTSAQDYFKTEQGFISYNGFIVVLIFTVALLFQLVSGKLMKWLGASNFLLAVSGVFFAGYVLDAVLINSSSALVGISISYSLFYMLLYYFSEPCFQLFFKMLPLSQRDGYRFIAQSIAASGGIILGACMQLLHSSGWMTFQTQAILGVIGGFVLIVVAWFGKVLYMNKLIENIQDLSSGVKEMAVEVLGSIRNSKNLTALTKFLQHPNVFVREIALEIIGTSKDASFNPMLLESATDSNQRIRTASLGSVSVKELDTATLTGVAAFLNDAEPEVRVEAIRKLSEARTMQSQIYDLIRPALKDEDPRVRAEAINAIYYLNCEKNLAECEAIIDQLLHAQGESVLLACEVIYTCKLQKYSDPMMDLANSIVPSYRIAGIKCLGMLGRTDSIPKLMELVPLADKELYKKIVEALSDMGEAAVPLLLQSLNSTSPVQWHASFIALSRMGNERLVKSTLVEAGTSQLNLLFVGYEQLKAIDRRKEPDLYQLAEQRLQELSSMFCDAAWAVLLRLVDERVIESLRNSAEDENAEVRENAYEALAEGFGDRLLAAALLEVLKKSDHVEEDVNKEANIGIDLDGGLFGSDHWLIEIASYRKQILGAVAVQGETKLLSLIDKIIFLKQVSLFSNLSLEELGHIANIATEEVYQDQAFLLREGEVNTTLFIIIEGNVEQSVVSSAGWEGTIGVLGPKEAFGDSAVFEKIPSTFTAQALLGEVKVLSLKGEHLERLVRLYPEMGIGFLRASSARVRMLESMITKLG